MSLAFGLSHEQYVTLLPKSVTTAIGIGVVEKLGGIPAISAVMIIITGVLGDMFAEGFLKLIGVKERVAKGVAIGTSTHAVGTSRAMEMGEIEGAMSSLSIVVAGTNPMINEEPVVGEAGEANPMFLQLSASNQGSYLKPFDIPSTKNMIDTLGGYMGIRFNDSIAGKLMEDCGGHPYLIRMLCGYIYKYVRENQLKRPFEVSKAVYEAARGEFERSNEAESFYMMILEILQRSYPREYDTLKILAIDGDEQLYRVLGNSQIEHLTGYGLIEKNGDRFAIRYDTVKRFLQGKYTFERTGLNFKEQALEINARMNDGELRLRALVRRSLSAHRKELDPKQAVLDAMNMHPAVTERQKAVAADLSYKELFDSTVNHGCFFLTLVIIIEQNYDKVFSAIFDESKAVVVSKLRSRFNRYRQIPAHPIDEDARNWSDEDFQQFREDMCWLEQILDDNE